MKEKDRFPIKPNPGGKGILGTVFLNSDGKPFLFPFDGSSDYSGGTRIPPERSDIVPRSKTT